MKTLTARAPAIALMMAIAAPAFAQTSTSDIPDAAIGAVSRVDAFNQAVAAADFDRMKHLLAPAVLILESGGVDRGRDEYLDHHAKSDASFLAGTHVSVLSRTARIHDNLAWVATESEIHASKGNKPLTLLSTETVILDKRSGDWQIIHIHWSSRTKKSE